MGTKSVGRSFGSQRCVPSSATHPRHVTVKRLTEVLMSKWEKLVFQLHGLLEKADKRVNNTRMVKCDGEDPGVQRTFRTVLHEPPKPTEPQQQQQH